MNDDKQQPRPQAAATDAALESQQAAAGDVPTGGEPAEAMPADGNHLFEQLRADLEAAQDRLLRSQAELDNYRKRAAREIEDNRRYANMPLLRDLLPVLDNVERAIAAGEKTQDVAGLLEGVRLVAKQFEDVLTRHHCMRIPALNQPFDPNLHHAISQQATDEVPPGTVVIEAQSGYQLHDRVVRPSQVIVSTAKQQRETSD